MHVKSWTLVLCTMCDNLRDSALTEVLSWTITECFLRRMIIKNVLYIILLPFSAHYFSVCGYFLLPCRLENVSGVGTAGSFISWCLLIDFTSHMLTDKYLHIHSTPACSCAVLRGEALWSTGCYCLTTELTTAEQEQQYCTQRQGWPDVSDLLYGDDFLKIIFQNVQAHTEWKKPLIFFILSHIYDVRFLCCLQ